MQPPFLLQKVRMLMDEKQNTDIKNGFAKKIGRTHFLVEFSFKKDTTDTIKDKTKKLIWAEATAKND